MSTHYPLQRPPSTPTVVTLPSNRYLLHGSYWGPTHPHTEVTLIDANLSDTEWLVTDTDNKTYLVDPNLLTPWAPGFDDATDTTLDVVADDLTISFTDAVALRGALYQEQLRARALELELASLKRKASMLAHRAADLGARAEIAAEGTTRSQRAHYLQGQLDALAILRPFLDALAGEEVDCG